MALRRGSLGQLSGRTAWARNLETPLRDFLSTETGSAGVLLAATLVALVWVNVDASSYERLWHTQLSIQVGDHGISQDLRGWINSGLMTFFFFVVGLEARREFDMGELRQHRRVALPVLAGLGGMLVPAAIYLAINAGHASSHGWGAAISTDTAFALGMLALVGPAFPDRLRSFMLTVVIVDDIVALTLIATVYAGHVDMGPLLVASLVLCVIATVRSLRVGYGFVYALLGLVAWVAVFKSGVDPVVVGLVMGLMVYAHPVARVDLETATSLFREFREQPTPEMAQSATAGLRSAISSNVRLQQLYHPWTSYVIVPLFALANAGLAISTGFLSDAFTSPITLGILFGYVAGKPLGVLGAALLTTRFSRGSLRPPVGWAAVAGGGTIAGIGFTVSLLISALVFRGRELEEAKLGVLSAALLAAALTWLLFRATARLPTSMRLRALIGSADLILDLAVPVDPERDHIRGPQEALVTVLEYGDFECPFCGQAEPVLRELLADHGDVRYVWRHLPLNDVHPNAQLAGEAAEAASFQDAFWPMHDLLIDHQGDLRMRDLLGYAERLELDLDRFQVDLQRRAGAARIAEDVDSADVSGVSGTPAFFINGRRHDGAYDLDTLSREVRMAKARAIVEAERAHAEP